MFKSLVICVSLFVFVGSQESLFATDPGNLTLKLTEGSVKFLAKGKPSAIRIHGTSPTIQGSAQVKGLQVQGEFEVPVDSLDTGIGLRTSHMKEKYLEAAKFPKALFQIKEMKLPSPLEINNYSAEDIPLTGLLTLHGVQRPILAKASVRSQDGKINANVRFPVTLSGHSITIPTYLGITVTDEVEVEVNLNTEIQK